MFKIYRQNNKDLYDFTDYCGALSLRSSNGEISEQLSFDIRGDFLNEGDIIQLYYKGNFVYKGIVTKVGIGEYTRNIDTFDFGWYLNKSEEAEQFNTTVSKCIEKICNKFEIPIEKIVNIPITFKDTIKGTASSMINELIEYTTKQIDKEYNWEVRKGKFNLEERSKNTVIYTTPFFINGLNITKLLSAPKITKSIEGLVNAVKVVMEEDKTLTVLSYKESSGSIAKFGKIQKIETVNKEEKANASNIAFHTLKKLNKIEHRLTVELLGNIECRANKNLHIENEIMKIKGDFRILSCEHSITPNKHTMSLELEVIE